MNEPLIILRESEDRHPVRHFVDGDTQREGGAARPNSRGHGVTVRDFAQRVRCRAAEFGRAAAALAGAGLELARRR